MGMSDLFRYNPRTGVLRWKTTQGGRVKVGQVAGSLQTNHKGKPYERRYLHVRVDGRFLYVHRIVYEIMTGKSVPKGKQIDHRNNDGTDNRWKNLRIASRSENMMNRTRNRVRVYDLPKGIRLHRRDNLYVARLGKWQKYFKTVGAAKEAYDAEATRRFGEFARS